MSQYALSALPKATPLATKSITALRHAFFYRPAEVVAPALIGCRLVKRQPSGALPWGLVVDKGMYFSEDFLRTRRDLN